MREPLCEHGLLWSEHCPHGCPDVDEHGRIITVGPISLRAIYDGMIKPEHMSPEHGSALVVTAPPDAGEPMIRKFLDISTGHLPYRFFDPTTEEAWDNVPQHFETPVGVMVWVPNDPDDPGNLGTVEGEDRVPDEILTLWRYARARGCDYIMLDQDAGAVAALPWWEW